MSIFIKDTQKKDYIILIQVLENIRILLCFKPVWWMMLRVGYQLRNVLMLVAKLIARMPRIPTSRQWMICHIFTL